MGPTEFAALLDYQKIMSQLVIKETLAGLQQDLADSKARGKLLTVRGEVRWPRHLARCRCKWTLVVRGGGVAGSRPLGAVIAACSSDG